MAKLGVVFDQFDGLWGIKIVQVVDGGSAASCELI